MIPCSRHKYCFWQRKMLHYAFGHAFGLVILCFSMLFLTYSTPRTRILDFASDKERCFIMLLVKSYFVLPCFSWHILLQGQEFWILQLIPHVLGKKWNLLFICYYSFRFFAYLRGVVPYIWSKFLVCLVQDFFPRESYPLWAFLWEISLLTTTSLHLYYLYKACN